MDKASLDLLLGRSIRVDRGGPESKIGKLIAAKSDHFVVYNENDGMLYYKTDHIKSLTLDTRDNSDAPEDPNAVQPFIPKHIDVDDFASIVNEMMFHWVQINRGGPEKIEGVLVDANDSHITVIAGNEVIKILAFHIRNISYGQKKKDDQEKDKNSQDKNNQDKNNQDKDKNKEKN